jgi:hypothetical protein
MLKVKQNERHKRMANLTAEIQHVAPSGATGDVVLPPWAECNARELIRKHGSEFRTGRFTNVFVLLT